MISCLFVVVFLFTRFFFSLNERVGLLLLIGKYMHGLMQFQMDNMGPVRIDFILKNAERKNIDKQNSDKGKHSIQRELNAEKKI